MSTFNALLTSISYDDQGAYEVGFAAGVDHATGVADAGVGAAAGGEAAGLSDDDWWSTIDDSAPTEDSDDKWTTDDDWSDVDDEGDFTDDEEAVLMMHVARCRQKRRIATAVMLLGMYHCDKFMNKAGYRVPLETGYQWTMRTLGHRTQCYNMFRMHSDIFYSLHTLLVERYGLKSTKKMTSIETLEMFCGCVVPLSP